MYNKDTRGRPSSLIDDGGTVAAAYEYDEFGNTTARIGESFDNEICYTGQVYDRSTGLYYYNARFYDPEDGRFLTQDTYRGQNTEPETWHLYAYCANNPVNYVDPSGHDAIVLKSNFIMSGIGHMAVLIKNKKAWRYFSWDNRAWGNSYINKNVRKSVKKKKVYDNINEMVGRDGKKNGKKTAYKKFIYIKGNFKKSYNYMKKGKKGKVSIKKYEFTGRNCAWMAIHVLRKSHKEGSKKYKALYNLQYKKKRGKWKVRTIIPNQAFNDLSDIYEARMQDVVK